MKKLLVTGASGFLGWNLCRLASNSWDVFGTAFSHPTAPPDVHLVKLDLTDGDELARAFRAVRPDAVIHTAAASQPNFCETHREQTHTINVEASVRLAELCADADIPFVFTSSDQVFDGRNAPYRETDPVCPINVYGEQKLMAEVGILRAYPKAAVCRMPLMFGPPSPAHSSFVQPMIKAMKDGEELRLFTDEFRTPLGVTEATKGLLLALEKVSGIIHLAGRDRVSRYTFGQLLAETLELHGARLGKCRQADVPMAAARPPDLSMDISRAVALGFNPLPLVKQLRQMANLL